MEAFIFQSQFSIPKSDRLLGLGLFGVSFATYLWTLHPGLPPLDSAEFITASLSGGVAHPPGYPLLTLLGMIFGWVPIGELAARVNSVSAFFAALTVCLVFLTSRHLKASHLASLIAALTLAFTQIFWRFAGISEVFALHSFLVISIIWCSVRLLETSRSGFLTGIAFLFGLGAAHLHTLALLFLPTLFLIFPNLRLQWRPLGSMFLAFVLALLSYLYLPWAASNQPLLNQGNPDSWERFFDVFFRRSYGTLSLSQFAQGSRLENMLHQILHFLGNWALDWIYIGVFLSLMGLGTVWKRQRKLATFFLIYFFLSLPVFLWIANAPPTAIFEHVLEKQYAGPLILFSLLLAFGIDQSLSFLKSYKIPGQIAWLFLLLPTFLFFTNFESSNYRNHTQVADYASLIMDSIEENALVFSCYDTLIFSTKYLQTVEGKRPHAVFVSFNPVQTEVEDIMRMLPGPALQPRPGMSFSHSLIEREFQRRPIYFTFAGTCGGQNVLGHLVSQLAPKGVVYRLVPDRSSDIVVPLAEKGFEILRTRPWIQVPSGFETDPGLQELVAWYQNAYTNLAFVFRNLGQENRALQVEAHVKQKLNP